MTSTRSEPPDLARLPLVGTTWYRRGFAYWARRVLSSGFLFLVLGVLTAVIIAGFFQLVGGMAAGWRSGLEIAYLALCVFGAVLGWTLTRRTVRARRANPMTPREVRRLNASGQRRAPGLMSAGRLPAALLFPFLAPFLAFCLGGLCAITFVRELPAELGARRMLEGA